jgi:hypothetical protein
MAISQAVCSVFKRELLKEIMTLMAQEVSLITLRYILLQQT